jgi:hypothetical protein
VELSLALLVVRGPIFHSAGDETAFFGWVRKIGAVQRVNSRGRDLEIHVRPGRVSADELRELRAAFHRYAMDTSDLEGLGREG